MLQKEEIVNVINVLEQTKRALLDKDALKLKELSNNTIHSAASQQDSASVTIAVIIYTLSKLIEREDYSKIKKWDNFIKKFNAFLDLAISCLKKDDCEKYEKYIQEARQIITSQAINLKPYIQDVLQKAAINKGSKIYEHGVSLEQTSNLLGVTQWELSDYIGQKSLADIKHNDTIDVKKRARMAMEFFS